MKGYFGFACSARSLLEELRGWLWAGPGQGWIASLVPLGRVPPPHCSCVVWELSHPLGFYQGAHLSAGARRERKAATERVAWGRPCWAAFWSAPSLPHTGPPHSSLHMNT